MTFSILRGNALHIPLRDRSVQMVCTSPPYWGLRSYLADSDPLKHAELGIEDTPEEYVTKMVEVFREVRRVLKDTGVLWVNLGDSYNAYNGAAGPSSSLSRGAQSSERPHLASGFGLRTRGLKPKDLVGIPWRVAFALQADGWWLRQDIIWSKPNPMPESVTDRCTKAHEYIFLLTKSERYFYNQDAVREAGALRPSGQTQHKYVTDDPKHRTKAGLLKIRDTIYQERNLRSVWVVATQPTSFAHFAMMPTALAETCIKAGSRPGDVVFDPFSGAGTTALVADRLGRYGVGLELSAEYCKLAYGRIAEETPLFLLREPAGLPEQLPLEVR